MASRNQPPFNDLFHGFDDDDDEGKDDYVDFDDPYRMMGKDDDIIIINVPERREEEEQHLSQKLNQLSTTTEQVSAVKKRTPPSQSSPSSATTTTTAAATTTKKIRIEKPVEGQSSASSSASYEKFERMLRPIVDKTGNAVNMEHLYQMAIIQHQVVFVQLNTKLWIAYLHSGTGRLLNQEQQATVMIHTMPNIWPEDVKITMIEKRATTSKNTNEINDDYCLTYVHQILREFQEKTARYQTQLDMRKTAVDAYWTSDIEEVMRNFVEQQGIKSHRLRIEGKLLLVEYEYKDRCLELAFQEQNPHEYQMEKFRNLIQSKFDKEKANCEVALLKQRLLHKYLPDTIANVQLPPPTSLASIQNEQSRQRLTHRYEKMVQRTKSDMMHVYIIVAETKMNEYIMKFDTNMAQMEDDQRATSSHKKFNETMLKIIEQRLQNIDERLHRLYKLKLHFFEQAPTIQN